LHDPFDNCSYLRCVLAPPRGLDCRAVATQLKASWSIKTDDLAYAPVGFGSHHWMGGGHFVTVDDATDAEDLEAALRTACALRDEAALEFVVAPLPAQNGALVVPVADQWVMHVYDRLDVVGDPTFGPHTDPEVVELVRSIHAATPIAGQHAHREDFAIWDRDDLEEALDALDERWDTGPYADRARTLLAANADDVRALLQVHDRLVGDVDPDDWVVTHGEPHRGNVFKTTRGWAVVDWDTALIAPPERDFWDLPGEHGNSHLAMLYRLRWDLSEVAVYVSDFFDDHDGDANDDRSWEGFMNYIDLRRRWPSLL
jgi:hypothetical protein